MSGAYGGARPAPRRAAPRPRRAPPVAAARTAGAPGVPARVTPAVVLAGVAAGAVAVLALWWHDTTALHGMGDWLTNAGRISGLLAGYAVVVLLGLMARVPALDRGVGTDRLARWHSAGGRYVVGLSVAHGLLVWWGYAITAHARPVDQGWALLTAYPDVLSATVAALLLVGVGAVSARAARARLRYETWYYLHFYTYLAVALAFAHQFATGADFVSNPAARALWSAGYVTVAGTLLWFRFLTPVLQAFRHRLRVARVCTEAPGVVSVLVTGRHLDELRAEPGQFFRWRFLARGLWWTANPYSLSAAPQQGVLRITVREFGDHSRALRGLRPGTRVVAEGPYGAFTAARRTRRRVLLLAGGVGITPLRTLFETLPGRPGDVTLVWRASSPADLVLRHEIERIAAERRQRVHYLLGRRAEVGDPLTPGWLTALVPDVADRDVYLCGPSGMTRAATDALRAAGVPRRHVICESFEF